MGLKLLEIQSKEDFASPMPVFRAGFTTPGINLWPIFTADIDSNPSATAAALKKSGDRFWTWYEHDPSSHGLKVVDEESGEVLGGGRWALSKEGKWSPYDGHGAIEASWIPEVEARVVGTGLLNRFLALVRGS